MIRDAFHGDSSTRAHYDRFLAGKYSWISGGADEQIRKNTAFFQMRGIDRGSGRTAIDLGAGCGFQAIPLARAGFSVLAVDFCGSLLDELKVRAGTLPISTILGEIRNPRHWNGHYPSIIVCMGDTLTHLSSIEEVRQLIMQSADELEPGGKLVLSFRDYSHGSTGDVVVIPVRRDEDAIFLCRLEFQSATITVKDIEYSRRRGQWCRECGEYTKIRIPPRVLKAILVDAGFVISYDAEEDGMIVVIGENPV